MLTLIAIPATCWLCAFVVAPRTPLPGNVAAERAYSRLLGNRQRLLLLALLATGAALLALCPGPPMRPDPDLRAVRGARAVCTHTAAGAALCPELQPGGDWAYVAVRADGSRAVVPAGAGRVVEMNPLDDPRTPMR